MARSRLEPVVKADIEKCEIYMDFAKDKVRQMPADGKQHSGARKTLLSLQARANTEIPRSFFFFFNEKNVFLYSAA